MEVSPFPSLAFLGLRMINKSDDTVAFENMSTVPQIFCFSVSQLVVKNNPFSLWSSIWMSELVK